MHKSLRLQILRALDIAVRQKAQFSAVQNHKFLSRSLTTSAFKHNFKPVISRVDTVRCCRDFGTAVASNPGPKVEREDDYDFFSDPDSESAPIIKKKPKKPNAPPYNIIFSVLGTLGSLIAFQVYTMKNNMTWYEGWLSLLALFEQCNEWSLEWMDETYDKYMPLNTEPLLVDLETLKFPDYIPTLVMDLNKTIVHMEYDRLEGWKVVKRPGADEFFQTIQHYYELVIWSDDVFPVAQDVMTKWSIPVSGVLHRDQCKRRSGHYIKNIDRLGRRLDRIVMIDHDEQAFGNNRANGILIKEFTGDTNDRELYDLVDFLKTGATTQEDVRIYIGKHGGGDENIGRRFLISKMEMDKKVEGRRHLSRAFGGISGGPTASGGAAPGMSAFGSFPK
eukprot:Platyproteum_vivax@DN1948_c0_g1_i1.p1